MYPIYVKFDSWYISGELCSSRGGPRPSRLCARREMVMPHIIRAVPDLLQHKDWNYRYAGLMAISASAEGCKKAMEANMTGIVMAVLPYIADEHPRVRFACCNALGQMATDFSPIFQKKMHEKVLPGLIHLLDDDANPRVQSHTAAALVNFFEECPQNVLLPYLPDLCQVGL